MSRVTAALKGMADWFAAKGPDRRAPGVLGRDLPGHNITGGKRRSGKTSYGNKWLGEILNQCAWAAARSRDNYLSAQFWRLARRIDKKKAAVAVSHSILVICWHLLTERAGYTDLGGDYFVHRTNPDRRRDHSISELHNLGYRVTLDKVA